MNEPSPEQIPASVNKPAIRLSLSWRVLAIVLLGVIAVMAYVWKPWNTLSPTRTITVQGEAAITAVPDTYTFQPIFENADVKALTSTGNDAVTQMKRLGVKDADIKTTISASPEVKPVPLGATQPQIAVVEPYPASRTSTYIISATVHNKDLAQKVSDYLATTKATGQVTPTAGFTKATQTKLDLAARSQASDDAKAKASVTAKQLGARVGRVIKISDFNSTGIYSTDVSGGAAMPATAKADGGPTIQPGTNEVNYSFTVEFELQ